MIVLVGAVLAWPFGSMLASDESRWEDFKARYDKTYNSSHEEEQR